MAHGHQSSYFLDVALHCALWARWCFGSYCYLSLGLRQNTRCKRSCQEERRAASKSKRDSGMISCVISGVGDGGPQPSCSHGQARRETSSTAQAQLPQCSTADCRPPSVDRAAPLISTILPAALFQCRVTRRYIRHARGCLGIVRLALDIMRPATTKSHLLRPVTPTPHKTPRATIAKPSH